MMDNVRFVWSVKTDEGTRTEEIFLREIAYVQTLEFAQFSVVITLNSGKTLMYHGDEARSFVNQWNYLWEQHRNQWERSRRRISDGRGTAEEQP